MADLKGIMERIPTVARLYYTGLGSRRYKRASTQDGPGEPLVHRSHVEREITRLLAERTDGVARPDDQTKPPSATDAPHNK